jgi:acyl transferase domain-containing protein
MSHDIDGKHASAVEIPFLADPVSIESDSPQNSDSVPNTSVADVYSNGVEDSRNSTVNGHNYDFEGRKSHLASRVFILSSSDEGGIKRTIEEYHRYLSAKSPLDEHQYLNDLAYTLAMKRTIFPWKSFVVAGSLSELVKRLPDASKRSRHTRKGSVPKVGFVFTGQGAQWHAMGRELLIYPVFRRSLEMASTYLSGLCSPWDLMGKI